MCELALKRATVCPTKIPVPMFLPGSEAAGVRCPVGPCFYTVPMLLISLPLPLETSAVDVVVRPVAAGFSREPVAFVGVAVGVEESPFS